MCIIAICDKRKLTDKEIKNCFNRNRDGVGVGWVEDHKVYYRKGFMDLESFKAFYDERINVVPHVVHFRLSSSGKTMPEMCHPYIVSEHSPLFLNYCGPKSVLFHNGHLGQADSVFNQAHRPHNIKPLFRNNWNDSRAVAVMVAREGTNFIKNLPGRFVILTPEKIIAKGFDEHNNVNGVRFSNWGYLDYTEHQGNVYCTPSHYLADTPRPITPYTPKKVLTLPKDINEAGMSEDDRNEVPESFASTQDMIDHYTKLYMKSK